MKTDGTTWLEEVIGLAEAGGAGLALAKEIYAEALSHMDELCQPYATVIDIDRSKLPAAIAVSVAAQVITLDEALSAAPAQGKLAARNAG